jgi:DNA polymerase-3 subunit alpha
VSRATAAAVVQARREEGTFSSLFELCGSLAPEHLDKRALSAMIKAGAMDSFACGRQSLNQMLPEVLEQARRGQMALFDRVEVKTDSERTLATQSDWDESTKLAKEKEALGFYLSGHPLSEFRFLLDQISPGGTARLGELPGDSPASLGGVIEEIRVISSRKGEPLHFLRMEDFYGSQEVIVFTDVYSRFERYILKGAVALVRGRIARERGQVRLVAEDIMSLEEAALNLATSFHLHLSVEGFSAQSLRELYQLFKSQLGQCPVYLHFNIGQHTEVIQRLPSTCNVHPSRDLIGTMTQWFGEGCCEVRYSEAETQEV